MRSRCRARARTGRGLAVVKWAPFHYRLVILWCTALAGPSRIIRQNGYGPAWLCGRSVLYSGRKGLSGCVVAAGRDLFHFRLFALHFPLDLVQGELNLIHDPVAVHFDTGGLLGKGPVNRGGTDPFAPLLHCCLTF